MQSNGLTRLTSLATPIFWGRLATALVQALFLYLLAEAMIEPKSWPATHPAIYYPALLVFNFVPLIIIFGLGKIPLRWLALWALTATLVLAGLGHHQAVRGEFTQLFSNGWLFWPRLITVFGLSIFISQALIAASSEAHRFRPPYNRHFEIAWRQGLQLALAFFFTLIFWVILELGTHLFWIIGIHTLTDLIEKRWFYIPATTFAVAMAIHATDVADTILRASRTLILTLFSWLLPILTTIVGAFLITWPFAAQHQAHIATAYILPIALWLVLLINSTYQDGAANDARGAVRRFAARAGGIELLGLTALATWAIAVRVGEYGWTVDRIEAAAITLLIAGYAIGYGISALRRTSWLGWLEITNFVMAYIWLALVLALFSPLADPSRLMVADQLARLRSGAVTPEKFDFAALKFDGASWGKAALTELAAQSGDARAQSIAQKATAALAQISRFGANFNNGPSPAADIAHYDIEIFPAIATLPPEFYTQAFWRNLQPSEPQLCMSPFVCEAHFIKLAPGSADAILFISGRKSYVFSQDATQKWQKIGSVLLPFGCWKLKASLKRNEISAAPAEFPDLMIGGQRVPIIPDCH